LPNKTLIINELSKDFDHLKVMQTTDGVNKPLDVEEFMFVWIRNQQVIKVRNTGAKFDGELRRLIESTTAGDWCQITNVRTKTSTSKIAARTFLLEDATPQYKTVTNDKRGFLSEQHLDLSKKDSTNPVFKLVDEMPSFVGGNDSMFRFLGRNIQYPKEARDKNIEGTVYIGFVVEQDGAISTLKVLRNVPPRVDTIMHFDPATKVESRKIVTTETNMLSEEAMRVIRSMPKWKVGKQRGKPVRVAYTLPIKFKLD
jgi:Gram-negative bacterial TonB protein C-terminal